MKKNVFSRAMAVLASMAVLGAASMMTAGAADGKGVKIADVEVEPGTTEVSVPITVQNVSSQGFTITVSTAAPLNVTDVAGCLLFDGDATGDGMTVICAAGAPYGEGKAACTLTVSVDANAEPGTYPINLSVATLDDNGTPIENDPEAAFAGSVTIVAPETEPETEPETDAPATDAPATDAPAIVTTKAATTTAAKKSSPKTGDLGVAVAVAGLVTAGATAVVLKKRH